MINKIFCENFKILKSSEIPLASLNIFTGLNGMGKSTVLQVLMLLRQSSESLSKKEIQLNGRLVEIGKVEDAYCEEGDGNRIRFELSLPDGDPVKIQSEDLRNSGSETVLKIQNDIDLDIKRKFKALFGENTFMYLNADRIAPNDNYETDETSIGKKQLGNRGQFAPHFFHKNKNKNISITELAFNDSDEVFSLEYQLNQWLGVISPQVSVHTEEQENHIYLKYNYKTKEDTTKKYTPKNAGFGLTYVFSVLTTILSAKKGDLLLIENPESHIHPKGQAELARLLAKAAKNDVQILIETHSDHILYGVRIAIKEQEITNDLVNIYYLDKNNDYHFSNVTPIRIDEYGRMERSMKKYFQEYEYYLDKLLS